jgi:hypothetical protein
MKCSLVFVFLFCRQGAEKTIETMAHLTTGKTANLQLLQGVWSLESGVFERPTMRTTLVIYLKLVQIRALALKIFLFVAQRHFDFSRALKRTALGARRIFVASATVEFKVVSIVADATKTLCSGVPCVSTQG